MAASIDAKGVFTICPTPFDDALRVDADSIRTLVDFLLETGVTGLAILGFLGELHKLSNAERRLVLETFVKHTDGRVPVWVGVRAHGIAGAIEQALEAQELGASAVFAAPLDNANDALLFDYYKAVADAVKIPVVIHDFPDSFGTEIRPEVVARLGREGGVHMIKMEEPPVGQKISRIRELRGMKQEALAIEVSKEELRELIKKIEDKYRDEDHVLELRYINNAYQFLTKAVYHEAIQQLQNHNNKRKLSQSALETLAIIAYRQPITKLEIEQIRGVSCDYSIQRLLEKKLIKIAGKADTIGKPLLYATSQQFMDHFGINGVRDLPQLKDIVTEDNAIGETNE